MAEQSVGKVVQVVGPVVDVQFPPDGLPELYNAIEIDMENGEKLVVEVQQHLGGDRVPASWYPCGEHGSAHQSTCWQSDTGAHLQRTG